MNEIRQSPWWVIEAPGPFYLGSRSVGVHQFYWTHDVGNALQLQSESQADALMMSVRELQPDLFPKCYPRDPRPVQHQYLVAQ